MLDCDVLVVIVQLERFSSLDGVLGSLIGLGRSGTFLVQVHEFDEIELGLLEKLDLADHAVILEREDLAALLLDALTSLVLNPINKRINNFNFGEKTLQNSLAKID